MSTTASVDSANGQKRNIEHETNSKKIRMDSAWIVENISEQNFNVSVPKMSSFAKSQINAPSEYQGRGDTVTQESSEELIIVKNICKEEEKMLSSPVSSRRENQTSEFVDLSSTQLDSIDDTEYIVFNANISKSSESGVKDTATISKKSSDTLDAKSMEKKNNIEDVELVLVPADEKVNKNESTQNITNRYSDAGNKSHTTPTMINKVNVQPNIQNKPVVVSTKKFIQDVMQTTAKVSIGNTTISVPLLKPLNSKQLLNSGFTLDSPSKTHSIKYQQTVTQPKTQLNCVSKILNIKRNQKGGINQPTIVSLSQLQIKPVSNAKILQAKVLGKKIPLQLQVSSSMPTQLSNPISSPSVTQISTKTKASIARNIITNIGPVNIHNISTTDNEKNSNEIDSAQYGSIECSTSHQSGESITKSTKNVVTNSTVSFPGTNQEKTKCVTTVKKFGSNDVSTPPSLTPLGGKYTIDQKSQPQSIAISSGVNIVKQNSPQSLITTPALNTSICSTSLVSEFNSRSEMITSKQAIVRNKAHGKVNTITFPKNISLMLAKGTVPQQSKTVMGKKSEASIGLVSSKVDNKSSNACITINKNIGDIQTLNESITSEHILLTASHSDNSSEIQESTSIQNKTFKILNNQVSTLDQQTIKRLKMSNDDDDDNYIASTSTKIQINTKKQNIKMSSKASTSENNTLDCEFDNVDEVEKKHCSLEPEIKLSAIQEGDKLNINHNCNILTNSNNIISTSVKPEETHNVLLKQLLQNCTTIPNSNQALIGTGTANTPNTDNGGALCSQVLQNRKVTNMRAPSLGLVSSLEAQLARPVIPPVSTGTAPIHRQNEKQDKVLIFVPTSENSNTISKISHNPLINSTSEPNGKECKLKSPTHIISKETSFVSNPSGIFGTKHDDLLDNGSTKNTSNSSSNEHKDTMKNDIYTSSIINQTEISTESKGCRFNKEDSLERVSEIASSTSKAASNVFPSQAIKTNSVGVDVFIKKEKTLQKKTLNEEDNLLSTLNMVVTAKAKEDELKIKKDGNVKQNNGDIFVAGTIPSSTVESPSADARNVGANIFGMSLEKNYPAVKDIDLRKKRKREYQKQRRQMLNINKEVPQTIVPVTGTACVSTTKRRPRKISKIEEDYDSFIDNLMVKVRQMAPLEVQEPLLNKSIAMSYEKQNTTRSISNKTVDSVWKNSLYLGEYGCLNHSLHSGIYDTKDGNFLNYTGQNVSVIQNDFYDQEFIPVMYRNETDKLTKFISIIKERNMEVLNTVNNKCSDNLNVSYTEQNYQNMSYPGLILTNKSSSENLGRMSPIVHVVTPDSKKCVMSSQSLPIITRPCLTNIKHERKNYDLLDSKFSNSDQCNSKDSTVVVSLHLLSSENVLSILRDLANILNISPLTNYKIYKQNSEEKSLSNVDKLGCTKWDKKYTYSNLQNIISGKRKICLTCGDVIHSVGIRIVDSNNSKKKYLQQSQLGRSNTRNIMYFCNKTCYNLYRSNTDNSIEKEKSKSIYAKSLQRFEEKISTPEPNKSNDIKKSCFKYFTIENLKPMMSIKNNNDKDLMDMLLRLDITVTARNSMPKLKGKQNVKIEEDTRQCILCSLRGDGLSDGASRLLNFEVDKWVHLNCALWSNGVYETVSGGLMNLQTALHLGMNQSCSACHTLGATIKCFKNRCGATFHLPCAIKNQCVFYKNKTIQCAQHASRTDKENELSSLTVHRRVFVERDENCQVAAVMHHHTEQNNLLRVGSLTFLNIGQLLPHQLEAFHTPNHIYPIGYKIIRLYWSMKRINKRCRYICSIAEVEGKPEFRIQIQEPFESEVELRDTTANAVWQRILDKISVLRKDNDMVRLFPKFVTGEDLFGLTEPTIVRIIESLPGIENLTDYRFKYGRNPLLELPLAVNPTGCARTEPKQRQLLSWRKPHTQRSATTFNQRATNTSTIAGEVACPYSKQFVHSKSSQYKKMKQEWRNNVYLARSKIQGLGLYAARDIEKHTMIIEYIGEVIRTEVSELREKQYESKNRGIYMFRLDEDRVVDATLSGGLARYINHSCNPNCVTETVEVDRELRIIIFAKRRINRSEELSYDYKFDIEDDAHKIPCMCGTPNCRKWMN